MNPCFLCTHCTDMGYRVSSRRPVRILLRSSATTRRSVPTLVMARRRRLESTKGRNERHVLLCFRLKTIAYLLKGPP